MFQDIDKIKWHNLTHAYGESSDVPGLIRDLASPDKELREKALYALYGNIWHQGTVYEATSYAVPFLVEILESPITEDKHEVLDLLLHLAHGYSYLDVHQHLEFAYTQKQRESSEFKVQLQKELAWVELAYLAVADHAEVYLRLAVEGNEKTRTMAILLAGRIPSKRELVLPRMRQFLVDETSISVQSTILLSLARLSPEYDQPSIEYLMPYLKPNYEPVIRYFAAESIARLAREKTPQLAIDILVAALNESEKLKQQYDAIEWTENEIAASVGTTLCYIGLDGTKPYMPQLIASLEGMNWMSSISLVEALLYLLFGTKKMPDDKTASDLDELQLEALASIREHALIMKSGTSRPSTNGNVGNMLHAYGLPSTPEKLADFLQI